MDPATWIAIASALSGVFGGLFGRGGGSSADTSGTGQLAATQAKLIEDLFPELKGQLQLGRLSQLRNMALTDPDFVSTLPPELLQSLGLNPHTATIGAVPLRRAVNNLSFGLLPRWARAQVASPNGFTVFQGTPEQRALLQSSPRERFGRTGFGDTSTPTGAGPDDTGRLRF